MLPTRAITNAGYHVYCWGGSDSLYVVDSAQRSFSVSISTCKDYPMCKGFSSPLYIEKIDKNYIEVLQYLGVFYNPLKDRLIVVGLLPAKK